MRVLFLPVADWPRVKNPNSFDKNKNAVSPVEYPSKAFTVIGFHLLEKVILLGHWQRRIICNYFGSNLSLFVEK